MDFEDLPDRLKLAGEEYLDALRTLGLEPEGLAWARANKPSPEGLEPGEPGKWHLVLITSVIDEAGPLELNKLLFKAYDLAATPREVSPFMVSVFSSKTQFPAELAGLLNRDGPSPRILNEKGQHISAPAGETQTQWMIQGYWFQREWVYKLAGLQMNYKSRRQQWLDFKQNVGRLAA